MPRGRKSRDTTIVHRQEKLALDLLDRALEASDGQRVPIDVQLDVFEKVGKWVSIKNRLTDLEDTDIDRFKRRIHGSETQAPQGRRTRGDAASNPEKLAAIKSRLAGRDSRSIDGDSGNSSVEVPSAA